MELKMVRDADSFRPSVLGQPGKVHEEILTGRDSEMSWEDVYNGQDGLKLGSMPVGMGRGWGGWRRWRGRLALGSGDGFWD